MSESIVLMTGVGGQGVQLLAKTLGLAAMREGQAAMMTAEATDSMRGGHSAAAVAVGERPLRALPVVDEAAFALVLHVTGWEQVLRRLREGAIVFVNELFPSELAAGRENLQLTRVAANDIASRELGSSMAAGLVLLGSFASMTGIVQVKSLVDAMTELLPPYRRQHIDDNARALWAGASAIRTELTESDAKAALP
jgi:2-oxoglutarate ferredoxin oxidoreductase subunit gamma